VLFRSVRCRGALNREAIDHCKGRDLPAKLAQEVDILGCGGTCLGTEPEVQVDLIAAGDTNRAATLESCWRVRVR
jgi:hypothetical protein